MAHLEMIGGGRDDDAMPANDLRLAAWRLKQLVPMFTSERDQRIAERTLWSLEQLAKSLSK